MLPDPLLPRREERAKARSRLNLTAHWNPDAKQHIQIRRRFILLGQTLDGMRVRDIRRAIEAVREMEPLPDATISLLASWVLAAEDTQLDLPTPEESG